METKKIQKKINDFEKEIIEQQQNLERTYEENNKFKNIPQISSDLQELIC